jgi:hypothetical protein
MPYPAVRIRAEVWLPSFTVDLKNPDLRIFSREMKARMDSAADSLCQKFRFYPHRIFTRTQIQMQNQEASMKSDHLAR